MKRKLSGNTLLFLCISSLVACGGGGGDGAQEPPDPHSNAYITIEEAEQPIICSSDYEFGIQPDCKLNITGEVYHETSESTCIDPRDGYYTPGSFGVVVTWENSYSTTAAGGTLGDFSTFYYSDFGNASLRWEGRYVLTNYFCFDAHWDANDIPLAIGGNRIVFTAIGTSGQVVETEYNMVCRIGGAMATEVTCQCDAPLDPTIPFDCRANGVALTGEGRRPE